MAKKSDSYEQILDKLKRKEYAPVYYFMGEEPYYIDLLADYIEENVLDEMEKSFNQTVLYGKDTDIRTVINAAKRFPMGSQYQVVIVKEAQQLKAIDELSFYLQKPLASTILVFCHKYGTLDKRKKVTSEIEKNGVLFVSEKLRDYQIPPWIVKYLADRKVKISEKAALMLTEFLGTDLSKVANELDKLLITKPASEPTITPELIEKNIGISKDFNNFELQSAIVAGDVLKVNRIVRYFADNPKNNPIIVTLSVLFNFFSNLMVYHYLQDKSQANVARELGVNPYFVKDFQAAAKRFSAAKTLRIIAWLRECDAHSKGIENVSTDAGDLLKELVYKMLH
ncbi:DNA polymerase III subunit delta [Paludibacter sp.]|uniref:DNA polymerase III subunit delta n=1 Tax=Paludibacter sp. TaxID=1898105 RepID=UPI001353835A|nr:DNA polymerase III subunit delta [Paludibacter sp.]MTK53946.1 DNA polymerase III subunit delta [Paludibacter sp.]